MEKNILNTKDLSTTNNVMAILYRRISITILLTLFILSLISTAPVLANAFSNKTNAVKVTAETQTTPPQIALKWQSDHATDYSVYRKGLYDDDWGDPIYTGSYLSYTDTNVEVGKSYEYRVNNGYDGYILVGLEKPAVDYRGKLILIVDETFSTSLVTEINRLKQDLMGDGWQVISHDVSRSATPAAVKALIQTDWGASPEDVKMVLLFGHVPVPYSGNHGNDGHGARAWPADLFYGDMDGVWTDTTVNKPTAINPNIPNDGVYDQSFLQETATQRPELAVGRIDLSDMPEFSPLSEEDLLRQYLDKNHSYRHAIWTLPQRGFIWDMLGGARNYPYPGVMAWRNFIPMFGSSDVDRGGLSTISTPPGYLWVHANSTAGYRGLIRGWSTSDFKDNDSYAAFYEMFGSYFGDWDTQDNLLRAPLATTAHGLTNVWSNWGRWQFHHMANGEPIGTSVRRTLGNNSLYNNAVVYPEMNLMGDPTLRLHTVKPISGLLSNKQPHGVSLNWSASPSIDGSAEPKQQPLGYHVYRQGADGSRFERLTSEPIATTNYVDVSQIASGKYTYMVRAVVMQSSPSGKYVNMSQGILQTITITKPVAGFSLNQASYVNGTSVYRFGHNSIPNMKITGAPADTSFGHFAMLHDGYNYRLYLPKRGSKNTIYQFAFNWVTRSYEYGHNSVTKEFKIVGMPKDANSGSYAMLYDGRDYRLYMRSRNGRKLYQAALKPGTNRFVYGYRSIRLMNITNMPKDATNNKRWAMLHDGKNYRLYIGRKRRANQFYQFAWNGRSYKHGFRSVPRLIARKTPANSKRNTFAMLHDRGAYRYYYLARE